jgi:hypothetical protein
MVLLDVVKRKENKATAPRRSPPPKQPAAMDRPSSAAQPPPPRPEPSSSPQGRLDGNLAAQRSGSVIDDAASVREVGSVIEDAAETHRSAGKDDDDDDDYFDDDNDDNDDAAAAAAASVATAEKSDNDADEYDESFDDAHEEAREPAGGQVMIGMWRRGASLGEGAYGDVYEVTHSETQRLAAMKVFKQVEDDDPEAQAYMQTTQRREVLLPRLLGPCWCAQREAQVAISKVVSHPCIVALLESFTDSRVGPVLVFERLPMNVLDALRAHPSGLPSDTIKHVRMRRRLRASGSSRSRSGPHRSSKLWTTFTGWGSSTEISSLRTFWSPLLTTPPV